MEDKKKKVPQYICATHDVKEEDLNLESKVLQTYQEGDYKLTFKNVFYPVFKYERERVKLVDGKLPYGETFTTAFNEEGSLLACGYSNGHVNIFNLNSPKTEPIKFECSDYPVTSIKWNNKKKTTLLVGCADGYVTHWHVSSGKNLHSIKEIDNAINSVDFTFDYKNFITAGNDMCIRLYDENMKSLIKVMRPYKFDEPGHTGRIFTCKYFPNNTSTIYSGGWDKTIVFYDTRSGKVANSIYGPEICGDSLDMNGYTLASGAWGTGEQIQLWDVRTLKCICNVKWENNNVYMPTYIYSVKFNKRKDRKFLGVGAVNKPLFRVFDMKPFNSEIGLKDGNEPKSILGVGEPYYSCFTVDFAKISSRKELFCCGCGDGGTRVYELETKSGY